MNLAAIMRQLASDRTPEFTPDEIVELINWLPDDCATAASVAGGKHHLGWGQFRYMLKALIDSSHTNGVIAMKIAAGKKASRVKTVDPWPDPERQLRMATQLTPKARVSRLRSHFGTPTT